MNSVRVTLAILILSCWMGGVSARAKEPDAAIDKVVAAHVAAWNKKDIMAMKELFLEEADHVASNGSRTVWRNAIVGNYKRFLATKKYAKSMHKTKTVHARKLTDNVVLADVETTLTGMVDSQGKKLPGRKGIYTLVLVKTDSDWKISALRSMVPRE